MRMDRVPSTTSPTISRVGPKFTSRVAHSGESEDNGLAETVTFFAFSLASRLSSANAGRSVAKVVVFFPLTAIGSFNLPVKESPFALTFDTFPASTSVVKRL